MLVELGIVAWTLHEMGGNVEGCQAVVGLLVERAQQAYTKAGEFELHCRIIAATRADRDLTPLFDALHDNHCFDMLLTSDDTFAAASTSSNSSMRIDDSDWWHERRCSHQTALVRYLCARHPDDAATLGLVWLRFGRFGDLARRLEECATDKLRVYAEAMKPAAQCALLRPGGAAGLLGHQLVRPALTDVANSAGGTRQQTSAERVVGALYAARPEQWHALFAGWGASELGVYLTVCMQELLQAADHHTSCSRLDSAARCFGMVALVQLQRRVPRQPLLFLARTAALDAMAGCRTVHDALVVADAYHLRRDLSRAVYAQVVVCGNMRFADDLRRVVAVRDALWYEVAKLFELHVLASPAPHSHQHKHAADPANSNQDKTRHMRALVWRLDDKFVAHDIATKLGFADIAARLRDTVPALNYFRR